MTTSGQPLDMNEYKSFLADIGYLVQEPGEFKISTNVDPEMRTMAGSQLVADRQCLFELNRHRGRWGSL